MEEGEWKDASGRAVLLVFTLSSSVAPMPSIEVLEVVAVVAVIEVVEVVEVEVVCTENLFLVLMSALPSFVVASIEIARGR